MIGGVCVSVGWLDVFIVSLTGRVFRGGIHSVDFCGQTWVSVDNGGQVWCSVVRGSGVEGGVSTWNHLGQLVPFWYSMGPFGLMCNPWLQCGTFGDDGDCSTEASNLLAAFSEAFLMLTAS